jgi:hypothetical protein
MIAPGFYPPSSPQPLALRVPGTGALQKSRRALRVAEGAQGFDRFGIGERRVVALHQLAQGTHRFLRPALGGVEDGEAGVGARVRGEVLDLSIEEGALGLGVAAGAGQEVAVQEPAPGASATGSPRRRPSAGSRRGAGGRAARPRRTSGPRTPPGRSSAARGWQSCSSDRAADRSRSSPRRRDSPGRRAWPRSRRRPAPGSCAWALSRIDAQSLLSLTGGIIWEA